MDYKYKYLKYKNKYIKLVGGSINDQTGGVINWDKSGYYNFDFLFGVKELCENTYQNYKNCDIRKLNTIKIMKIDDETFDHLFCATNMLSLPRHFMHLIAKKNSDKIVFLDTFFNSHVIYDLPENCIKNNYSELKCSMENGVIVERKNFNNVFKDPNILFNYKIESNGNFNAAKGAGRKNLKNVVENLKNNGVEYIILHPAGSDKLINYYKNMGFNYTLNNVVVFINDKKNVYYNPDLLMGQVDDILNNV